MSMKIVVPTPNLAQSLAFYNKLNFTVEGTDTEYHAIDGKICIEISRNKKHRKGLRIYNSDADKLIALLAKHTEILKVDDTTIAIDRNGLWYYISETESTLGERNATSILGTNFGISIETAHMTHTMELLQIIGFEIQMNNAEQGFVQLKTKDDFYISLMKPTSCPHLFNNPALNYFNGKENRRIIENIKSTGLPIFEEITAFNREGVVDNISLCDPSGLGFFIFND